MRVFAWLRHRRRWSHSLCDTTLYVQGLLPFVGLARLHLPIAALKSSILATCTSAKTDDIVLFVRMVNSRQYPTYDHIIRQISSSGHFSGGTLDEADAATCKLSVS